MEKRLLVSILVLTAAVVFGVSPAGAEGRPIAGIGLGAMLPQKDLDDFVDRGGLVVPFAGYMFNDYLGLQVELPLWATNTESVPGFKDGNTWVLGGTAGPRLNIPLGGAQLYGIWQGGIFTALSDAALTDTSFGFSAGGGFDVGLGSNWSIGPFVRWNRLYQRVHGQDDAKYITAGLGLTYDFVHEEPPPPPPARVVQAPPPPPPPVRRKIVLRGVHFDFDKATIRPDARPVLDEAVDTLRREGGIAVVAEGHTDSKGSNDYNQRLSLRRAAAVRDYLVAGGIAASRIRVEGFGESKPVATNETDDGRAQNRRVELRVIGE